jgi:hypothetical protein
MTAFDAARNALTGLKATGEGGLEGLVRRLLSAHFNLSLRPSSAGSQAGQDMGGGTIAVEVKRYDKSPLNVRELAGELSIAKGASETLGLWVLVSTQALPQQRAVEIERSAGQLRVVPAIVDWSPVDCPQPLVLIARYRDVARHWFLEHAPASWGAVNDAIKAMRRPGVPFDRVSGELDLLASGLALAGKLEETLRRAVDTALGDATGKASKTIFGQRIDFRDPDANAIIRAEVLARLEDEFGKAARNSVRVLGVLGFEGVGKTWAVVDFVTRLRPRRPLLFFSSALMAEAELGGWSPSRLVREALRRSVGVLHACDRCFQDEAFLDGFVQALGRTECDAFRPICVFDGFNERRGKRWGDAVADLPWLPGQQSDPVVVTARPPQWRLLASDLDRRDVTHAEIRIDAFSDNEFAEACEANDIDPSAFDRVTAKDMRNPRLFRIAAGLADDLAGAPVTRERIFCEYWRHRQREGAGEEISPEGFARLLTAHVKDAWRDLEPLDVGRTRYFDQRASREAARFAGVEDAVRDVQDALSSGFFQLGRRDDSGELRLASDRIDYVLGLSLQRRLVNATDEERELAANRRSVDDRLAVDIDPIAEFDAAAVIVGTALLATCLQTNRNHAVALTCLVYLLELRNARNQEVAPTVRGMVLVAACADPAVFVAAVEEMGERDPWLVEALRTALAASRDGHIVADALDRWLGEEVDANDPVVTALHVLAGHELGPYLPALARRRSREGQHDLVFWLALLDEASRPPVTNLLMEDALDTGDGEDLEDEEEFVSTTLIGARLREDFERASLEQSPSPDDTEDFLSADGLFGEVLESGEVPVLPPTLGHDWLQLDERLPTALAARWSGNDPSVQLLYVQLLENRFAVLAPEGRLTLLASVCATSPPPSSPSNYELKSFLPLPPNGVADLLAAALGTQERLLWTLGWLNYFSIKHFEIPDPVGRDLIAHLVDVAFDPGMRADIAFLLTRSGSVALATRVRETGWRPNSETRTAVALHASAAMVPLCRERGAYRTVASVNEVDFRGGIGAAIGQAACGGRVMASSISAGARPAMPSTCM